MKMFFLDYIYIYHFIKELRGVRFTIDRLNLTKLIYVLCGLSTPNAIDNRLIFVFKPIDTI